MSDYICPFVFCVAWYRHRQSLDRHLLERHQVSYNRRVGLQPISPGSLSTRTARMRRNTENSRQRHRRREQDSAAAAAAVPGGPLGPRSQVGPPGRPGPVSREIPPGQSSSDTASSAAFEVVGSHRRRQLDEGSGDRCRGPTSMFGGPWQYSPRGAEADAGPSTDGVVAAIRSSCPPAVVACSSGSSTSASFRHPSGGRPASGLPPDDEFDSWPMELDDLFAYLPGRVEAGTQTVVAPVPAVAAALVQTELTVPSLASPFPLPWGTTPAQIADLVVMRPDLVPIRVAWHFNRRAPLAAGAEASVDHPPTDDLSQCVLELAASVAVETVDRVKTLLLNALAASVRRDPTGSSILHDCGVALERPRREEQITID